MLMTLLAVILAAVMVSAHDQPKHAPVCTRANIESLTSTPCEATPNRNDGETSDTCNWSEVTDDGPYVMDRCADQDDFVAGHWWADVTAGKGATTSTGACDPVQNTCTCAGALAINKDMCEGDGVDGEPSVPGSKKLHRALCPYTCGTIPPGECGDFCKDKNDVAAAWLEIMQYFDAYVPKSTFNFGYDPPTTLTCRSSWADWGFWGTCDGVFRMACPETADPPFCPFLPKPGARKDPHFSFAHGGRADIRGEAGEVFNFLSAKNISLNIGFEAADFRWSKRLVHGTRIHAAYWTILAANGKTITVAYAADKNATALRHAMVTVSGTDAPIRVTASKPFSMADVRVSLKERALTVVGARWSATATASAFPFASLNKDKVLLDLEVKPLYDADADLVAPHGLWGQSFDGDGMAVDGAVDAPKGPEMTTAAQAEGAIEGTLRDYRVATPFATDFKYSRYGATSAKHRDVTKIIGAKTHKHHGAVAAGARGGVATDVVENAAVATA
jgi:hypothetical protein